jgi:dihydrofolate reductase
MRKVVLGMNITLDGYAAGPGGELDWMFPGIDEELNTAIVKALSEIDTFLMGRITYEGMASHWPNADDQIARLMNAAEKVVFSTELLSVDWERSRLATSNLVEEIARLKQQPGQTIGIAGGPQFAQAVIEARLIDEYRLTIHPVVLTDGKPLFNEPQRLKLTDAQQFNTGAVVHTYSQQ